MTRTRKIIYWVATIWVCLGMTSSAIVQLLDVKEETIMMERLGYPHYFQYILGVWKILGVIVVLIPRVPLLKEWAYAGFFFSMSGAAISHIAVNDGIADIFPSLFTLALAMTSWWFRPASRRLDSRMA